MNLEGPMTKEGLGLYALKAGSYRWGYTGTLDATWDTWVGIILCLVWCSLMHWLKIKKRIFFIKMCKLYFFFLISLCSFIISRIFLKFFNQYFKEIN